MLMPNLHLGRAYALLGDWDKALAALEKVRLLVFLGHSSGHCFRLQVLSWFLSMYVHRAKWSAPCTGQLFGLFCLVLAVCNTPALFKSIKN